MYIDNKDTNRDGVSILKEQYSYLFSRKESPKALNVV
jgi:hypothetical protein